MPDARAYAEPFSDSYWLSSLELRHGVEVQFVGVRAVGSAVIREFLRMHEAWQRPDRRALSGRAAAAGGIALTSSLARLSQLDIAFEVDGSVTIPGDLEDPTGRE